MSDNAKCIVRCSGTTKRSTRCKRKQRYAYCYQHQSKVRVTPDKVPEKELQVPVQPEPAAKQEQESKVVPAAKQETSAADPAAKQERSATKSWFVLAAKQERTTEPAWFHRVRSGTCRTTYPAAKRDRRRNRTRHRWRLWQTAQRMRDARAPTKRCQQVGTEGEFWFVKLV